LGGGLHDWILRAFAALAILVAGTSVGHGAGAMAVGACAAYGYAFDFTDLRQAESAALTKCSGQSCKLVLALKRSCAAFAIDGRNVCGPHGYASARRLGQAENVALQNCYKYGGKDCVIRAFICDAKG
jgi:hypothetical protein